MTKIYRLEWSKCFDVSNYMTLLRDHAVQGNLRNSHFRSVCWKLFLGILPEDQCQWVAKTQTDRSEYNNLKDRLITNPRDADGSGDIMLHNPLSQSTESIWNQFFQDNELRLVIKQDVIRTYPSIEFFQSNQVRNTMVNILFVFARLHPDLKYQQVSSFPEIEFFKSTHVQSIMTNVLFIFSRTHQALSYQQGMHELLAPIIFVLHCDHESFLHSRKLQEIPDTVAEMMDPEYLEHDAYYMFSQVMATVEPWYISSNFSPGITRDKTIPTQPFLRSPDLNPSNAIVSKLTRIQDYLLTKHDMELHNHLQRLDIAPQIYGIRWVRLLFGREFPMQDLLALWDALFSDGAGFDLIDHIFVAMLLYIRDLLLASDYPNCLITLMHYPPATDVQFFIEKALWLREPTVYPRPPNYTYQTLNSGARGLTEATKSTSQLIGRKFSMKTSKKRPEHLPVATTEKSSVGAMNNPTLTKSSSVPVLSQTERSPVEQVQLPHGIPRQTQSARVSSASTPTYNIPHQEASSSSRATTPYTPDYPESPAHSRKTSSTRPAKEPKEMHQQIAMLTRQLADQSEMRSYCGQKLGIHIDKLQSLILKENVEEHEDDLLVALAGIKQVRDILNETLSYSRNILEDDADIVAQDHSQAPTTSSKSDNDLDPDKKQSGMFGIMRKKASPRKTDSEKSKSTFYATTTQPYLVAGRTYELLDKRQRVLDSDESQKLIENGGVQGVEVSPNPLYRAFSTDGDC